MCVFVIVFIIIIIIMPYYSGCIIILYIIYRESGRTFKNARSFFFYSFVINN